MASNVAERQAEEQHQRDDGPVSCFLIISEVCDAGESSDDDHVNEAANETKCRTKMKALFLGLGFICIVVCFVFAALGYMKFRTCPAGEKCERDSQKFSEAQNYRLAAALLFIVGICLIIAFVWLVKREGATTTHEFPVRHDVVVSDITAEGLLKSPAPELPHPLSHLHSVVYEISPEEKLTITNDLPHYESAVKLLNEGNSSVTPDGEIITRHGVEMESVCTQVDEDDINPPPSYLQALELENESQEELQLEERDTG